MTSFSQLLPSLFSDNSNIMLAAIISLLLVILFVLLLHLYAKWFLAHAHAQAQSRRRRRRRPVTVSDVLSPSRFHHFHSFNLQDSPVSPSSPSKGLDSAAIAAIPVFVYEEAEEEGDDEEEPELECVICLSAFGDGEIGRSLPKCAHAFHVDCIDMWLASHSNCPICRAPIVSGIVETHHSYSHSHSLSQLGSVLGDDSSAVLEIVIDSPTSENTTESERGSESLGTNSDSGGVSDSAVPMSETSSSLLRSSLKRMLSKVFPSKLNQ